MVYSNVQVKFHKHVPMVPGIAALHVLQIGFVAMVYVTNALYFVIPEQKYVLLPLVVMAVIMLFQDRNVKPTYHVIVEMVSFALQVLLIVQLVTATNAGTQQIIKISSESLPCVSRQRPIVWPQSAKSRVSSCSDVL